MYLSPLAYLNLALAIGGLALAVITLFLAYDLIFRKGAYLGERLRPYLFPLLISTTVGSVFLSLLYSEYFGFIPCSLCWLQRIAIYPQALLAILAFRRTDTVHFPVYGLALSLFGLAAAMYHYMYQMIPTDIRTGVGVPCLADGSADCASKVIDLFGFVTFPFLSAVTFAFLITLYFYLRRATSY